MPSCRYLLKKGSAIGPFGLFRDRSEFKHLN